MKCVRIQGRETAYRTTESGLTELATVAKFTTVQTERVRDEMILLAESKSCQQRDKKCLN